MVKKSKKKEADPKSKKKEADPEIGEFGLHDELVASLMAHAKKLGKASTEIVAFDLGKAKVRNLKAVAKADLQKVIDKDICLRKKKKKKKKINK